MITEDELQQILRAGTYAATGMGKQSPIIIAVTKKELRDQFCGREPQDHGGTGRRGSVLWSTGNSCCTC